MSKEQTAQPNWKSFNITRMQENQTAKDQNTSLARKGASFTQRFCTINIHCTRYFFPSHHKNETHTYSAYLKDLGQDPKSFRACLKDQTLLLLKQGLFFWFGFSMELQSISKKCYPSRANTGKGALPTLGFRHQNMINKHCHTCKVSLKSRL